MANQDMLFTSRLGARFIARSYRGRGALVRQFSFYGPVSLYLGILLVFFYQGATGAKFAPHSLFGKKIKFAPKLIKKIFQLPQNRHFSVVNCHGSFLDFRRILSFRHWFIDQEKMINQVKFRRL